MPCHGCITLHCPASQFIPALQQAAIHPPSRAVQRLGRRATGLSPYVQVPSWVVVHTSNNLIDYRAGWLAGRRHTQLQVRFLALT